DGWRDGPLNGWVNSRPALPVAPPPGSGPLNEPPLAVSGTSARSTIGRLPSVLSPVPRCSRRPSSPAWPAGTRTVKVPDCPGVSLSEAGETAPPLSNTSPHYETLTPPHHG